MSVTPKDINSKVVRECRRRRYSEKTIKTYLFWINDFLKWCGKEPRYISKKDVRLYLEKLSEENKSGNTMNVAHMSLRFLFENVLEKRMWIDIKYSKVPEKIQRFLTREEAMKLLNAIPNWKHRLMIEFIYGSGLRVSELINVKVRNLNLEEDYGFVRNGKGGKDRLIVIPFVVKEKIRNLIEIENLDNESFVFSSNRGSKYNLRTIQQIVKKASKKAKLNNWKEIHPHTLRHSFATQLISNGNTLSEVQSVLGHKSPETSMIYVHSSPKKLINIKSPLDFQKT